jgi:phage nucleotide-binding protein
MSTQMTKPTNLSTLTEKTVGGLKVQQVQDRRPFFNFLVYGEPGVGKTVLCGSAMAVPEMSPVLLIDVEGGTYSLRATYPDVDVVRVQSMNDMQRVYDSLHKGQVDYKTVVLDSLTEIQKFSMLRIMREVVEKDPDRDPEVPGLREWGKNIEQTRRIVRGFRDLPMNVLFTALAATEKMNSGKTQYYPSLSGKLAREVAGFMDIVGYQYKMVVKDEVKFLLLTNGTDTVIAKDRSSRLPKEPIENPTMAHLYAQIVGSRETN